MKRKLFDHHQKTIDNLVSEYKDDPRFKAIIIGGSVAKGVARSDSDLDFMIVATEEEFAKRSAANDYFINRTDLADYPGGFVDGKVIDVHYLADVDKNGNEPSRAAFDGAFVAYSNLPDLDDIIARIALYPKEKQQERMHIFYCMSFIQNWLMGEADRHDNLYAKSRAANQLVLYAGRLILAYNQVLFPYHKWFFEYLKRCESLPEGFMENAQKLLTNPCLDNANLLFKSVQDFNDWGISDLEAYTFFMNEVEWSWRDGVPSFEDL